MKTRTTMLALAALTLTSLSALVPTSASAWGMRGGDGHFAGSYRFGGHFGGFRPSYRPHIWASAAGRPYIGSTYRPYATYSTPTYAPAPIVTHQRTQTYLPVLSHAVQPVEEPCENAATQFNAPRQQPYQDHTPANYASTELQK